MSAPQRPSEGVRKPRPRSVQTAVVVLLAAVLAFAGLAVVEGPATAAGTDIVNVPDARWKAVLNKAIGKAKAETRTDAQDITQDDALRVTSLSLSSAADRLSITSFAGVEAFTNVTTVSLTGTRPANGEAPAPTASDLAPFAGLTKVTSFQLKYFPDISDLSPLASLLNLKVFLVTTSKVSDFSPVVSLPQLTTLTVSDSKVTDLSSLGSAGPSAAFSLNLSNNQIVDISGLAGHNGLTSVGLPDNRIEDIGALAGAKGLTSINLDRNRIEDVSLFSTFDSSYAICGSSAIGVSVAGNHIRDLSATCQGIPTAPKFTGTDSQTVYVGPYTTGGVTVGLKARAGWTPRVTDPAVGSYDTATGVLTSVDPAAPLLAVREELAFPAQFSNTWTVYFSEDPAKINDLRINEVESNSDVRGDWVELYNPSPTAVDLSGVIVSDSDNTHQVAFPAATTIPGHGYRAIVTDDSGVTGNFGLGAADSARVFSTGTIDLAAATPIDSYSWTEHADTTYGRTVPGAGIWATTDEGTFEAENVFPAPAVVPTVAVTGDATSITGSADLTATVTKPGSSDLATDATGTVVFTVDGMDKSPLAVTSGTAQWTATGLAGSPTGTAHTITARYVSAGGEDPYDDSTVSSAFTVTVTIGEFSGTPTLSTTTPLYCDTITSDVSGISPTPDQVGYQWQNLSLTNGVGWVNIAGATDTDHPMYAVSGDTVAVPPLRYRLVVTVTKAGYNPKTFQLETDMVRKPVWDADDKRAAVLSTTTPRVGQTITATHEAWPNCLPAEVGYQGGYDYQWLRDGQPITGATDSVARGVGGAGPKQVSYTVTPADLHHTISLRVAGIDDFRVGDNTSVSEPTAAVAAGAFSVAPAPTIDNATPKLGDTLAASTTAWSPAAELAYEWLRDGAPISGATGATYTTAPADVAHAISVQVTGTADGYETESKRSGATAAVTAGQFSQAPAPVVDNTSPKVGDTLTASVASWSPVAELAYQWLRDSQPIAGASGRTYRTVAGDVGHAISVRVTGSASGYTPVERTSAATAKVATSKVSRSATVKVTALKGRKVQVRVSVQGLASSALNRTVTVQVAGAKGSFSVRLKKGVGTFALKGAKAKKVKTGEKSRMTVTVKPFSSTSGSTTYEVKKTTKAVKVKVRK